MFSRKKKSEGAGTPPPKAETSPSGGRPTADAAIDLAAELLRGFGEHAFDVGETAADATRESFDQWARHLLVGASPPGRDGDDAPATAARRDLGGLRRAFRDHRRAEHDFVVSTFANFREATWAFLGGLRKSLAADRVSDADVSARMVDLESAVRDGDPTRIRQEAQETVGVLARVLAEREERNASQIAELAQRLEALRAELDVARGEAATDALTGLFNRGAFDEQIEREVDLALLFRTRPSLLLLDLDHFKRVNDEYGHRCGDEVLRRVASALSRCFMRKDDYIARYGGEEFAIVLREVDARTAAQLAERALETVRNLEIAFEDHPPLRVTASIGLAELRAGASSAEWIERADRALYRAKDGGRDRIVAASATDAEA